MALKKYKLGDLLTKETTKNSQNKYAEENVRGVSNNKTLIASRAKLDGIDFSNYLIVKPRVFVFNPARLNIGSIAFNNSKETFICSPMYEIFKINDEQILLPEYLCMYINREQFNKFVAFHSWGSVRECFSFDDFCNIEIYLPSTEIQQKYVNVYKAMVANQKAYEKGLDDLKLVCDAYIENLRKTILCEEIGKYIFEKNNRNTDEKLQSIKGVSKDYGFTKTRANLDNVSLENYKIVNKNNIAYNPSRINIGSVALCNEDCVVSPMYVVFETDQQKLLPEYLILWLNRKEFQRSTLFYAMGSVRDTFDFKLMQETQIPIPNLDIQRAIANIYKVYCTRKEINEKLKAQIKDLCPILIAGAINEAKKEV